MTTLQAYNHEKSRAPTQGDVVLIVDDRKKRHLWKMGRVLNLYPGKDGRVRVARVKVGGSSMLRPIQRLVPLEVVQDMKSVTPVDSSESPAEATKPTSLLRRSQRQRHAVHRY